MSDESEKENSFWADVYYYMEEHECSKDVAMKMIEQLYRELDRDSE